jgi:hypothetical protein
MKYAVEMGSAAMMCIPCFLKTGSDIQKFSGGGERIHRQNSDLMSLFLLFNKESWLKVKI